ncbi:24808_t:CDS:2, partial [Dentiscutata erythropus]
MGEKILPLYFNLLPQKPRLPSIPQNLNSATQYLFPCNPKDSTEFRHFVEVLRQHYSFKCVPSDFFVQKQPLPQNPTQVATSKKYSFSINDPMLAKEFLTAIQNKYCFTLPLPEQYIIVNSTNKPELPLIADEVKLVNITTPITSLRVLVETARLLREYYYFKQISANWVNIPQKASIETDCSSLLSTLDEIRAIINYISTPEPIILLATSQQERGSPHIIDISELPVSKWELFNNYVPD